jgi:hypothetical protein
MSKNLALVPWTQRVAAVSNRKLLTGLAVGIAIMTVTIVIGCIAVALNHKNSGIKIGSVENGDFCPTAAEQAKK